jgi:hypothetical protein
MIPAMSGQGPNHGEITAACEEIKEMLLAKNAAYGDSVLNPVRIFSDASAEEQLLVRIDDKLSRLQRGKDAGEDTLSDLIGYLILLKIQRSQTTASRSLPPPDPRGPGPA